MQLQPITCILMLSNDLRRFRCFGTPFAYSLFWMRIMVQSGFSGF
jgi:hypothetical protein